MTTISELAAEYRLEEAAVLGLVQRDPSVTGYWDPDQPGPEPIRERMIVTDTGLFRDHELNAVGEAELRQKIEDAVHVVHAAVNVQQILDRGGDEVARDPGSRHEYVKALHAGLAEYLGDTRLGTGGNLTFELYTDPNEEGFGAAERRNLADGVAGLAEEAVRVVVEQTELPLRPVVALAFDAEQMLRMDGDPYYLDRVEAIGQAERAGSEVPSWVLDAVRAAKDIYVTEVGDALVREAELEVGPEAGVSCVATASGDAVDRAAFVDYHRRNGDHTSDADREEMIRKSWAKVDRSAIGDELTGTPRQERREKLQVATKNLAASNERVYLARRREQEMERS